MFHLFTLGWPWLSGALALGALIGFLSYSNARDATFSGGWIVILGILTLACGAGISVAQILDGRDAATFDIGLALSLAYAAGLPLGGFFKSFGGEQAAGKPQRAAPIVVTHPRILAPAPVVPPTTAPERETIEALAPVTEPGESAPAAPPLAAAEKAVAVTPAPKRRPTGLKPECLSAPRNDAPDDLSRIKGIGPKSLEKLTALGVFHYDQIAAWNLDNARWIGAAIGAPGRVERDKWIQQARSLAGAGTESR